MDIITYDDNLQAIKNALDCAGIKYDERENNELMIYTKDNFYVGKLTAIGDTVKLNGYKVELDDRLLFEMANADVYHTRRRELMLVGLQ